jgi:GNAT superfamily N-acetyltransferase
LGFLKKKCTFRFLCKELLLACNKFNCDNDDLNDFFSNDYHNYSEQLLGKTYCFTLDKNPKEIVCAFTIANDSIKARLLPRNIKKQMTKNIPFIKRGLKSYPAVLIGRLGVSLNYQKRGIGKELMNFIKAWFIEEKNKTGCRFIVVDAYDKINQEAIKYYKAGGFEFIFKDEKAEKEYTGIETDKKLDTRLMYYDLILLK